MRAEEAAPGSETPGKGRPPTGRSYTPGGGLIGVAIARPVTVAVGAILVVLFGAFSVARLPIQLTPDVAKPTLTIVTAWPGSAPEEVESEILEEQEDAVKSVPGLLRMTSEARPDQASLTLEFEVGTDIEEALVRAGNRLQQVDGYPEGAREPVVDTADSTGPPLAVITMRSPTGADPAAYRTWVDQTILPEIERIPGVGGVRHLGGRDTEVHVDFDPAALAARNLTVASVASVLGRELENISAGDVTMGKRRYLVRTRLAPESPEDLEAVVIGTGPDGTPIRLGDVAVARQGYRKATGVAMSDDRKSMVLLLSREAGTNVLAVTERIKDVVATLDRTRFEPEGLEIEVISDQTGYINGALALVRQNLLLGAGFAVLVLWLFLRSAGASAVVSVAIPVCVFATALGMNASGRTVNVVSLAGITFAVGMVLDNSIVALEAIDSWRSRVETAAEAAWHGIREVGGALLASTLTTAAVFIPIIFWEGEVGQLVRDVAVAISVAVVSSLVVALLVIPSFSARLLRPRQPGESGVSSDAGRPRGGLGRVVARVGRSFDRAAAAGGRLRDRIVAQVRWLVARRSRSAGMVLLAVGLTTAAGAALLPPIEYLPTGNRNLIFGILVPPPGYSPDELERIGARVQAEMAAHTGQVRDGVPAIRRSFFVGSPERLFAGAVAEDPARISELVPYVRRIQSAIPGVISFTTQASLFGRAVSGGRGVELDILGADLTTLTEVGGLLFGKLRERIPGAQIRPVPTLDPGAPELRAFPRRDEVAALRFPGATLGQAVDAVVDGAFVGEWGRPGEPEVDVVLRARPRGADLPASPALIAAAPVATPSGDVVPLGALTELREELGPTIIRRIERRRAITLAVSPPAGLPLEEALSRVEALVDEQRSVGTIPSSVQVEYAGTAGELARAKTEFRNVLLFALLISFLLLAALFENVVAPVVILVTVPLAAAGGVAGLRLVDATLGPQPLDLLTGLGFLILLGVVVNNAILVVDGALARLRDGTDLEEAIAGAVASRVRPIFMTTATSLAGLAPMVVFPGSGSELYRGVGAIVLGGLALSTVLTLYVVPSLFRLIWRVSATVES